MRKPLWAILLVRQIKNSPPCINYKYIRYYLYPFLLFPVSGFTSGFWIIRWCHQEIRVTHSCPRAPTVGMKEMQTVAVFCFLQEVCLRFLFGSGVSPGATAMKDASNKSPSEEQSPPAAPSVIRDERRWERREQKKRRRGGVRGKRSPAVCFRTTQEEWKICQPLIRLFKNRCKDLFFPPNWSQHTYTLLKHPHRKKKNKGARVLYIFTHNHTETVGKNTKKRVDTIDEMISPSFMT